MLRSFRARITVAVIGLVGVSATLVAVVAFTLVERSLREQLVDTALNQADFNVGILASDDVLARGADADDLAQSGLVDRFLQRGPDGVYVEFPASDETFASAFGLVDAGSALDPELRELVAQGRFGYQSVALDEREWLVVGARRPPDGPDFYFFYSRASDLASLDQLRTVLVGAVAGVVLLGALVAGLVARSMVRPVRRAGIAARTMARGDLSVRLEADSEDELGQLAESFNDMAAALQRQLTELDDARRREQRFVADVSHELRTPLTGLVGAAGLLRDRAGESGPDARRLAELVSNDIDRLRRLVEDLLEMSALDADRTPHELSRVDVTRFLEAVAANRGMAAAVASDVGSIDTSPRSLERIVGNLLDNAALHAPGSDVEVTAARDGRDVLITVADTGPGVPSAALPHLFDRFYSPDPARQGGTGLGLAIARQHARRLGGDIDVQPNQPHGLVFRVRIPVTDSLQIREGAATPMSHADGEQGGSP